MNTDGSLFLRRALAFLAEVRAGRRPSAGWLAETQEISGPTAYRVIRKLRDEYDAPLFYSDADRGWELTRDDWTFPPAGLVARRELLALALGLATLRTVIEPEIARAVELVRLRVAECFGASRDRLERVFAAYSCERTDRAIVDDPVLLDVLEAAVTGRAVRFRYASPWKDEEERERTLRPLGVQQVDGALYAVGYEHGQRRKFSLAFVRGLTVTDERFDPDELIPWDDDGTYGVWSTGDPIESIVRIAPPDARFHAAQRWHAGQRDHWDDGVLVRRLPAHDSPELVRRLLSLGPALLSVEPPSLRAHVLAAAGRLVGNLAGTD